MSDDSASDLRSTNRSAESEPGGSAGEAAIPARVDDLPLSAALAWIALPVAGAACGAAAVAVQQWYAPVGVFPLVIGLAVGAVVLVPLKWIQPRRRSTLVVAALVAALGCVAAHHYGTFARARYALAAEQGKNALEAEMIAALRGGGIEAEALPASVPTAGEYFREQWSQGRPLGSRSIRGPWLAVWWVLDGALTWLAAAVLLIQVRPLPPRAPALRAGAGVDPSTGSHGKQPQRADSPGVAP